MIYDVVIIGGGPAGLMAAYQLEKANVNYVLLEKNPMLGKKLLITGQGRCNVTNHLNTNQFIAQLSIPHRKFLYSSLSAFGTSNVVEFFQKKGVPLYQDGELKYFPKSNKAIDIRDVFTSFIMKHVKVNTEVNKISFKKYFVIESNRETIYSKKLIIATGSRSFPKTGSTGSGLKFAKSMGIDTRAFYPAETSIYSNFIRKNKAHLQGISIQDSFVRIRNTKIKRTGDLLFTHFGLSGPSIFHLSEDIYHEIKKGNSILEISLSAVSEKIVRDELQNTNPKTNVLKFLEKYTVKRLARFLLIYMNLDNVQLGTISNKKKEHILDNLFRFAVKVDHVESIDKAYVNGGGVLTTELNPNSFECKTVEGLYFIGESVDVHGPIGGFNVTIAFSSGYAASTHVIDDL